MPWPGGAVADARSVIAGSLGSGWSTALTAIGEKALLASAAGSDEHDPGPAMDTHMCLQ